MYIIISLRQVVLAYPTESEDLWAVCQQISLFSTNLGKYEIEKAPIRHSLLLAFSGLVFAEKIVFHKMTGLQTFTRSTIETLEKGVKYVQS